MRAPRLVWTPLLAQSAPPRSKDGPRGGATRARIASPTPTALGKSPTSAMGPAATATRQGSAGAGVIAGASGGQTSGAGGATKR